MRAHRDNTSRKPFQIRRRLLRQLLLWPVCVACSSPLTIQQDDELDSDTDIGLFEPDGVTPYMVTGTASCLGQSGDDLRTWTFHVTAMDEQGTQSIRPLQEVAALLKEDDTELFRKPSLSCNNSGVCIGSLREDIAEILCSDVELYTFKVFLKDIDENHYADGFSLTWTEQNSE